MARQWLGIWVASCAETVACDHTVEQITINPIQSISRAHDTSCNARPDSIVMRSHLHASQRLPANVCGKEQMHNKHINYNTDARTKRLSHFCKNCHWCLTFFTPLLWGVCGGCCWTTSSTTFLLVLGKLMISSPLNSSAVFAGMVQFALRCGAPVASWISTF